MWYKFTSAVWRKRESNNRKERDTFSFNRKTRLPKNSSGRERNEDGKPSVKD